MLHRGELFNPNSVWSHSHSVPVLIHFTWQLGDASMCIQFIHHEQLGTWILGREIFRGRRLDTLSWQAATGWVWTVVPAEWFIIGCPPPLQCESPQAPLMWWVSTAFPPESFHPPILQILLWLPTALSEHYGAGSDDAILKQCLGAVLAAQLWKYLRSAVSKPASV